MNRSTIARHLLLILFCFVCSCRKTPEPTPTTAEPEAAAPPATPVPTDPLRSLKWTTSSAKGNAEVTQVAAEADACAITCAKNGEAQWQRLGCLARATDYRFVSDDCEVLVILFDYPKVVGTRDDTTVGLVLSVGKQPVALRLSRFILDPSRLQGTRNHLAWLSGSAGQTGNRPRDRADGSGVELTTARDAAFSLSFAQLSDWKDTFVPSADRSNRPGLFQWYDDDSTQITTWAEVPQKFRRGAKPVTAEISVLLPPDRGSGPLSSVQQELRDQSIAHQKQVQDILNSVNSGKPTRKLENQP